MPSISEIIESVYAPALIRDEVIKLGGFQKQQHSDEPIYYSGGFTVVFPVTTPQGKWAFRCWHTEMGNVRERFQTISNYINRLKSPYFSDFHYCDSGLVVDGKTFPTTRMKWIDGEPINEYLTNHANNQKKLLSLAQKFLQMTEFLHQHHIAHGDLQHGNIIIENDDIKLIDYDSLYVPGLKGQSDIIIGKAEFQHPKRKELKQTSKTLDYFSELVIYLSIIAIAYDPNLINDFSIKDSLLFQKNDWDNFENSKIFKRLISMGNNDITILLSILKDYLKEMDITKLIPFSTVWKQRIKRPRIKSFICGNVNGIVFRNQETLISWDAENYDSISLNNNVIKNGQNCYPIKFNKDTEICLTIKNGLHIKNIKKQIKVVDAPAITFTSNKNKLKRNKQGVEPLILKWNVKHAYSVKILCNGSILSHSTSSHGLTAYPTCDSDYELIAIGLDKKTEFKSCIKIVVREPANVEFLADKQFSLPDVPVTISWKLIGAKNIKLNGRSIPNEGKSIFTSNSNQIYKLSYDDEFGKHSRELEVKTLPLPVIDSLLIEMPNIKTTFDIKAPNIAITHVPKLPTIQLNFANLSIGDMSELQQSELFIEPTRTTFLSKISQYLKQIFNT